jgi:glycosyltransferase involved in cell wall biosynthesis
VLHRADQFYNQSRIFIQPSSHEGFGYIAGEAVACGHALVTTDNGGSRDHAASGETALVVRLFRDDSRLARHVRAGSEVVRRRLDWNNIAAVLEAYLLAAVADAEPYQRRPADVLAGEDIG